jgi:hypothetical protein
MVERVSMNSRHRHTCPLAAGALCVTRGVSVDAPRQGIDVAPQGCKPLVKRLRFASRNGREEFTRIAHDRYLRGNAFSEKRHNDPTTPA